MTDPYPLDHRTDYERLSAELGVNPPVEWALLMRERDTAAEMFRGTSSVRVLEDAAVAFLRELARYREKVRPFTSVGLWPPV